MDIPNCDENMDSQHVALENHEDNGNISCISEMEPQNIEPSKAKDTVAILLSSEVVSADDSNKPFESSSSVIAEHNSDQSDNEIEPSKHISKKHKSGLVLDDSDSDNDDKEEAISTTHGEEVKDTAEVKPKKRIAVLDSDSDSEDQDVTQQDESFQEGILENNGNDTGAAPVYTTNFTEKIVPETKENSHKTALALLCDSDSDNEEIHTTQDHSDKEKIKQTQPKSTKSQAKPRESAKSRLQKQFQKDLENLPKKVTTVKEAAEQRKEIQSESQRMLRERNISLPYHKPKTRSLQEFLSRRPKLSRALPDKDSRAPPSVAIKMSNDQLELISKRLKEREREVKEFYKSESESDNEEPTLSSGEELLSEVNNEQERATDESTSGKLESALGHAKLQEETLTTDEEIREVNATDSQNLDDGNTAETSTEPNTHPEEINKAQAYTEEQPPLEFNEASQQRNSEDATKVEDNPITTKERTSESYEFQLDSSIEDPNTSTEVEIGKPNSPHAESAPTARVFTYTELDREIEHFGETIEAAQDDLIPSNPPPKSALELLKERLANDTPKLSGGPDNIIDLDSGVAKPREVVELMERFAKHVAAAKKHHNQHKVKLSIVTVESGGDIHKEEVAVNVDSDDEGPVVEEKPGAKLQKLKEDLQKQMEQKKAELWKQKATALREERKQETCEEGDENEEDILDDEEEADMTDEQDTDEELEDDVDKNEHAREKSDFLDDEAQVSDNEEEAESVKEDFEDDVEENEEAENEPEVSDDVQGQKKVLKRIVKPSDSDSEEEDLFNDSAAQKSICINLDSTITADEDDIPSHQPPQLKTPVRAAVSQGKSISDFLTPISFITSIQNLASVSKSNKKDGFTSPFRMPADLHDEQMVTQKKLFSETDTMDSQGSMGTQEFVLNGQRTLTEEPPNTQDLLDICSGQFTGITQTDSTGNVDQIGEFKESQSSELKSLGQEDMIISQLLDEEELEIFRKKFDSPVADAGAISENKEFTGGAVIDSDDEADSAGPKKRKNQKRIQFSDDDSSDDEPNDNEEEIDLQDKLGTDDEHDVAYDSEENEIDLTEAEERKQINIKDFVEAEAELSESEWGSADEDERDLDKLEFELGDTETFDEEQVKSDLEKIHMRRMLDDDTREVKLLQELLLEDGEMHGTGRQRQFKWKNIDLADEQAEDKQDDDIYFDEEESEEQWRKNRHEREMFLKQQKNVDVDDLLDNSQLLKIGQKILQKSQGSQSNTPTEKSKADGSPFKNTPFSIQNKRGSFLNRSDQVLHRVAEFTKVVAEVDSNSKKTTKHFLFQSVSVLDESSSTGGKKRKAPEGTPNLLKKLRLNTDLSPAIKKKLDKPERSRKLFNF